MKTLLCLFFISILTATSGFRTLQAQKTVKVGDMYYKIRNDNTVAIIGGDVKTTTFTIPSQVTIHGKVYPIVCIENKNSEKKRWDKLLPNPWGDIVQKIIIPSSVKEIGYGAFYFQKNLQEIIFPKSLTDIGRYAFNNSNIKTFDLSKTQITELRMNIFNNCYPDSISFPQALQKITINYDTDTKTWSDNLFVSIDYNNLKELANDWENTQEFLLSIRKLVIRNATVVESFKNNFLSEKSNVKELSILAPIKKIGRSFTNPVLKDGILEKVILGHTLVEIGDYAFYRQVNLKEIHLPISLKIIGQKAFAYCKSLKSIDIPLSVTKIGSFGFDHCESLTEIKGLDSYISDAFPFIKSDKRFEKIQKTFSYYALGVIKKDLAEWQERREFETTPQWKTRVTAKAREKRVKRVLEEAKQQYIKNHSPKVIPEYTLGKFDADHDTYPIKFKDLGKQHIKVPLDEAPTFKINLAKARIQPTYGIKDDQLAVVAVRVQIGDKIYRSVVPTEDNSLDLLADLPPLDINFGDNKKLTKEMTTIINNDVDINIPTTNTVADKTFAVIIANEAYSHEVKVPFALNDGEVFARYCQKTLGIPEKNIRVVKNATLNDMKFQLNWLAQVLAAYNGTAKAIVYYAGHGIPDEKQQSAYLLPADGYGSDPSTAYALQDFYAMLNNAQARNITVFLDACFSGAKRENGMLASARGVAIKVRQEIPRGKMVIFTAAQGDETAYQYAEKGHGMFTYFLLKKLQESQGNTTLGELSDYVTDEVKKNSIVNNNKSQTPTVIPAEGMAQGWKEMTLK